MRSGLAVLITGLLGLHLAGNVHAQTWQWITLADVLERTPEEAGPAPAKFSTPFLVVSVTPIVGTGCSLELATNGTLFSVGVDQDENPGRCDHLPALHALVWGRVRHSRVATFLRQSNTMDVASDYVDLVYADGGTHPKVASYIIQESDAIDADWGRVRAPQNAVNLDNPTLLAEVKANSAAGSDSPAEAASGHKDTQREMQALIENGQASECLVVTNPAGAEIYIDGKKAGVTPMAFDLYRHHDAERVITIKLAGYNTIEKKVSPDGREITLNLTMESKPAQ